MHLFFIPECAPFAIAAAMLAILTAVEMLCLLIGFSLGHVIDKAFPDHPSGPAGLISWINVGGVPLFILLMLLLGLFSIIGFVLQGVLQVVWTPLPALAASVPAFLLCVPAVRWSTRSIARIVPRDESYAVEPSEFVGLLGEVTVGPLDQGLPGRIRLKDRHGNWHVLRARAAKDEADIAIGASVLVVDRIGDIFIAILAPAELLTPSNL